MKDFFDCKNERITEKAFSQGLLTSVLCILLCVVALCSMTYAWFSAETSSDSNMLVSGSFDLEKVSVAKVADGVSTAEEITVTKSATDGTWSCDLAAGTYTVTLELATTATVKGHCTVTVGANPSIQTAPIIGDQNRTPEYGETTAPFTFTLTIEENGGATTAVTFEPCWGVVVAPDIPYEGVYPPAVTP